MYFRKHFRISRSRTGRGETGLLSSGDTFLLSPTTGWRKHSQATTEKRSAGPSLQCGSAWSLLRLQQGNSAGCNVMFKIVPFPSSLDEYPSRWLWEERPSVDGGFRCKPWPQTQIFVQRQRHNCTELKTFYHNFNFSVTFSLMIWTITLITFRLSLLFPSKIKIFVNCYCCCY